MILHLVLILSLAVLTAFLCRATEDPADQEATVLQSLKGPTEKGRFQRVAWTDLNRTLISAGEDGCVRRWDVEVGTLPAAR